MACSRASLLPQIKKYSKWTYNGGLTGSPAWTDWDDLQTKLDVLLNGPGMANKCPCGNPAHTATRKQANIWHESHGWAPPANRRYGHQGLLELELETNRDAADLNKILEAQVVYGRPNMIVVAEQTRENLNPVMLEATIQLDRPGYLTDAPNGHNHLHQGVRIFQIDFPNPKTWRAIRDESTRW